MYLAPDELDPSASGLLGEYAAYGTPFAVVSGQDAASLSNDLHETIAITDTRTSTTKLPNDVGVTAHVLGDYVDTIRIAYGVVWDHARRALLDVPVPSGREYWCSSPTPILATGTTRRFEAD